MNFWPFARKQVTASEAARALNATRLAADRRNVLAKARQIRAELGLPPHEGLSA